MGLMALYEKKKDDLRREFNGVETEDDIDAVFERLEIDDFERRSEILKTVCGIRMVYYLEDKLSPQQEYENDRKYYIDGSWRFMGNFNDELKF